MAGNVLFVLQTISPKFLKKKTATLSKRLNERNIESWTCTFIVLFKLYGLNMHTNIYGTRENYGTKDLGSNSIYTNYSRNLMNLFISQGFPLL